MLGIEHSALIQFVLVRDVDKSVGYLIKVTRNFMNVKSNATQPYTCVVCAVLSF